jgi:predicted Zn-dependent peptidase
MPNRTHPPERIASGKINIAKAEEVLLSNGMRLLIINAGTQDVSRLEFHFPAGSRYQEKPLVARSTFSMLTGGTKKFTSQHISEKFDFFGSHVEQSNDRDFGKITLFSLNKYLGESLQLLEEIVKEPTFPEKELSTYCSKGKQSLIVDQEKVSTLARQDFFKALYSENHPYGTYAEPYHYDNLTRGDINTFHSNLINSSVCTLILAGKIADKQVYEIEKYFGYKNWGKSDSVLPEFPKIPTLSKRKYFSKKEDAVQSAIRIGKRLFNRKHPDYPGVTVLNAILGGYFGSRLMKNIREDKGYTYGISSSILPFKEECIFALGTEVGSEFTLPTLKEIYYEINRLKIEPVSANELDLVKNYLLGEILRTFDGAFAIADSLTGLLEYNDLDYDFFDKSINIIKTITPDQLQLLANTYFREEDLVECVAGKISNI